jgi:FlgD Ig-like domain
VRALPPVAFALLAAATLAAFALAQRLKGEPPLIDKVELSPRFTPNGDGIDDLARIRFRVTRSDRGNVQIVDLDGSLVVTLARRLELNDFKFYEFRWDGRNREGAPARSGAYRLRVVLLEEDRSLVPTGRIILSRARGAR